jgi:hypothetical protein
MQLIFNRQVCKQLENSPAVEEMNIVIEKNIKDQELIIK